MKVTRLKRGYRINLSDAEMSVLESVFDEGAGSSMIEDLLQYDDEGGWTPAEVAVIRKLPAVAGHWFNITEDRRG